MLDAALSAGAMTGVAIGATIAFVSLVYGMAYSAVWLSQRGWVASIAAIVVVTWLAFFVAALLTDHRAWLR